MKKKTKNNPRIITKPHVYLKTMPITHVKFQKNCHDTVGGLPTVDSLSLSKCPKNVHIAKIVTKINLRIISKPHAYLQSMVTTSVKFQENRYLTIYSLYQELKRETTLIEWALAP